MMMYKLDCFLQWQMKKSVLSAVGLLAITIVLAIGTSISSPLFATTGMSNCTEEPESEDCNPQPDRVGNDHDENDEVTRDGPDDEGEENCWGKVSSGLAQKDDEKPGLGEHSSDPVQSPVTLIMKHLERA
jgi:hypothetical protein